MKRRYAAIGLVILLLLGLAGTAVVALSGADEAAEADVTEADVRPENKPSEQAAEPAPRPEERAKAATAERAEKAKARAKARPAEPAPTPAENADAPPGARIDAGQPVEPDAVAEKPSGQPRPAPAEDETTPPPAEPRHQAARTPTPPPKEYKAAVLHVVTNFEKADVTVNGLKYPEYIEPGEAEGMVLPAGGPYDVLVKFGENTKKYILNLRPHETRLLVVELSGYNSDAPPPRPAAQKRDEPQKKAQQAPEKPDPKAPGRITVYSKPAGSVVVDGKATGDKTPGTVELENGRHEVQVQYESGTMSEKKIVRVRTGSRIKLFFRERK